jgi:hypothetical protein
MWICSSHDSVTDISNNFYETQYEQHVIGYHYIFFTFGPLLSTIQHDNNVELLGGSNTNAIQYKVLKFCMVADV